MTQRTFACADLLLVVYVADLLWTCYREVANLLQTCYGETVVMDFGLKRVLMYVGCCRQDHVMKLLCIIDLPSVSVQQSNQVV